MNRPFKCLVCGKRFRRKDTLKQHEKLHKNNGEKFNCPHCNKVYTRQDNLRTHYLQVHGTPEERLHTCIFCDEKLSRWKHLEQHIHGHTNERPFACQFCPKDFKASKHLHQHLKVHQK
ncbi:putative zinc finger protein [Orchesella cincta]|uniref:Putative zinc finger protein n=1 Tax=Orchesella cincta TaxID=48709 RepID=A0A1D2MAV0_ORCCI|nr:putative zinc finger protein [Orchesella cincta]